MGELSKEQKEQIINQNLRQLEAQQFDLEMGISVNQKIGENQKEIDNLKERLIKINKKIEAYKDKLKEI